MAIPVKLEVFEGPLDLLLYLIDKNKVDIYDIPIVEITAQYLEYIRAMEQEDMNIVSPPNGQKPREVLITVDEYRAMRLRGDE